VTTTTWIRECHVDCATPPLGAAITVVISGTCQRIPVKRRENELTDAQAKIPMNPTFSTSFSMPSLARSNQFYKQKRDCNYKLIHLHGWPDWANFRLFGLFYFIFRSSPNFLAIFSISKFCIYFYTKGLGYILGDSLRKPIW
jgi:hypothetical protein